MERSQRLPQVDSGLFRTDGGLETVLIFRQGELPEFAVFPLLQHEAGTAALRHYYRPYLELARERRAGFVLESPTGVQTSTGSSNLGYGPEELAQANLEEPAGEGAEVRTDETLATEVCGSTPYGR